MGGHGAHDEMQVIRGDGFPVHALEVLKGRLAIAALVLAVSLLNLPVVDHVLVPLAVRGVAVDEGVLGLLERGERGFQQFGLLSDRVAILALSWP